MCGIPQMEKPMKLSLTEARECAMKGDGLSEMDWASQPSNISNEINGLATKLACPKLPREFANHAAIQSKTAISSCRNSLLILYFHFALQYG